MLEQNPTLTPEAEQLAQRRYFHRDKDDNIIENWSDLSHRIVNHVCKNEDEKFKSDVYELIYNTKFLPNSPCIVNSGKKSSSAGLLACYVSSPPQDSWDSMIANIKTFGDIARKGGGNGTCFSYIRPEGDPVFGSTHAKACGPIEHIRMISEVMSSITQSGFRGMANLASMHINHPDIEKFIVCKQRERALKTLLKEDISGHYDKMRGRTHDQVNILLDKFISNFNISVLVTDEFMRKVENDEDFDLIFNEKVYKTVKAKELFRKIAENAWRNGDPGLLFYDAINDCAYKYSGQEIVAANPCLSGTTLVFTDKGPERIQDIVGKECNVIIFDGSRFITSKTNGSVLTKKNAKVVRIQLEAISDKKHKIEIICTPDHQIKTYDGYIEAGSLNKGDHVIGYPIGLALEKFNKADYALFRVVDLIKDIDNMNVYDLSIEHPSHNFIANGLIVHNCGEQLLPSGVGGSGSQSGGSCNLGSIDISKYYLPEQNNIDWKSLKQTIYTAIQFLDNVIDANIFPTKEFKKWAKDNRPTGLGIMGWADLLLKLGITYGSEESIVFAEKVAKFIEDKSQIISVKLSKSKGTPKSCRYKELGYRRNITLTSIAPTGSISMLAGCSSSIEPIFSPQIIRTDNTGEYKYNVHPYADKKHFKCAVYKDKQKEVMWKEHIDMQAAFQKYGSSGISKTVNFSNNATIQDIEEAYIYAWKEKCKGLTVYRDGCKTTQVLNTGRFEENNAVPRPKELMCDIFKTRADGYDWHIIIGRNEDQPYELFAVNGNTNLPKTGKLIKKKKKHYALIDNDNNILIENLAEEEDKIDPKIGLETRRFSLELRHQIPPKYIVQQIDKSTEVINSFSKAAGRVLKSYLSQEEQISIASDIMCPLCASEGRKTEMISDSGCWKCLACSFSRCS